MTFSETDWIALCARLGLRGAVDSAYRRIVCAYEEETRHYHTGEHIAECLMHFESVASEYESRLEIDLAIWLHDVIYDSARSDNEQQSAEFAREMICSLGGDNGLAERVSSMIMATDHRSIPSQLCRQVLVDVDLAILGATEERFNEYEWQIEQEYNWVPADVYRKKRSVVLNEFAERKPLYLTKYFRNTFEYRARENLSRSLRKLGA